MTQLTQPTSFRSMLGKQIVTTALSVFLFALLSSPVRAQWGTSSSNIYNTNSGNVGIGTTTPAAKLEISGDNALPRVTNTNSASYGGLELFEGGTIKFGLHTLGSASGSSFIGGANAVQVWNYANGPMVFGTNSSERMRVDANGSVGIGVTNPDTRLSVVGAGTTLPNAYNLGDVATFATPTDGPFNVAIVRGGVTNPQELSFGVNHASLYSEIQAAHSGVATNNLILNRQGGNVGIGTTSPGSTLVVQGAVSTDGAAKYLLQAIDTAPQGTGVGGGFVLTGKYDAGGSLANFGSIQGIKENGTSGNYASAMSFTTRANGGALTERIRIDSSGNVGIGTATPNSNNKLDVNGNLNASGTITGGTIVAKYQDVAEWVPASRALPAGTVVTLDPTKSNHVEASSQAYDTRVAGVVSEQPGITLGESGENKVLVATTGRVRVTVNASRAPIHIGDLLVTSDLPGVAMKSEPITIGGRQIHSPGTLIGKALEPLEKGSGKILVLLSLQ